MGSDGLYDNLFDTDILACVEASVMKRDRIDEENAATCIGNKALRKSKDPYYDSPFAVNGRKHGRKYRGGKKDDITVIVAQVNIESIDFDKSNDNY